MQENAEAKAQVKAVAARLGQMLGLKAFVIVVLCLLFLVPLEMVRGVIVERNDRSQEVAREIADKWADQQQVQGPFLVIPAERVNPHSAAGEMQYRQTVLLPDAFAAQAAVAAETRSRGIFDTVVYTTVVTLDGGFTAAGLQKAAFETDGWLLRPDQAVLALGVSDLRGIQGDLVASWNGKDLEAASGMPSGARLPATGIQWPVNLSGDGSAAGGTLSEGRFEARFTLRGSGRLAFLPVGKSSSLEMRGDWPAPSFDGRALPAQRDLRDDGFSASWSISHLSRPFPQSWTAADWQGTDWNTLAVGASFVQPVDFYLLSERSVKYGLLIVALLFLIYFLFEVLAGIVLHPLQYLMIGAALVLFFLSLVSFAEVVGFAAAYALSGAMVVALVSLYTAAILRRWLWAVLLAAAVSALYGLLYVILNQEEAALLSGTLVLFAALAATMYATRRVDWFKFRPTPEA